MVQQMYSVTINPSLRMLLIQSPPWRRSTMPLCTIGLEKHRQQPSSRLHGKTLKQTSVTYSQSHFQDHEWDSWSIVSSGENVQNGQPLWTLLIAKMAGLCGSQTTPVADTAGLACEEWVNPVWDWQTAGWLPNKLLGICPIASRQEPIGRHKTPLAVTFLSIERCHMPPHLTLHWFLDLS